MAQYDLLLTQNVSAAGTEFSEKYVNVGKGGLLSANSSNVPTVLAAGTDGYMLVRDDAEATGLKWIAISAGHTQGTDTGTTSNTFTVDSDSSTGKIVIDVALNTGENHTMTITNAEMADDVTITLPATTGTVALTSQLHTQNTDTGTTGTVFELDSDGYKIELTAESASKLGVKVDGGGTYADLQVKDATIAGLTLTSGTISTAPSNATDIVNKTYADGLIAAADAMVFKGTVGSGGTHEIAAFNSLATYNAGWTYRVITAGTVKGKVCEIGDLVVAMVDRAGSGNVDADFTVAQTNLDGAVIGPASVTDGYLVLFDGVTGKLIKAGTGAPGTMAYETATNYVPKSLYDANTVLFATSDNTPAALLGTELPPKVWASAPADKIGTGYTGTAIAGQIARDDNWLYVCKTGGTATNQSWLRAPLATNW